MAEEISQKMGFDAAPALETLKLLDAGFSTFESRIMRSSLVLKDFNKNAGKTVSALKLIGSNAKFAADNVDRLNRIQSKAPQGVSGANDGKLTGAAAARAMNELLGQSSGAAEKATAAVDRLGKTSAAAFNKGRQAANNYAVSLETIVRVVTTQVIVRSLNALRDAIEDSFSSNLEFTKSLSEIQTIEADKSIAQLSAEVRKLSDSFNIPLLETANAKFEAIQNGFAGATQQLQVFNAAGRFSKTAVASMDDSVSLITGTLNSFGKSADEAELVAAKLFRTVDQGKVVGSELARTLGRVSPVAKELGVTLDEELAALSTITIAGVPASEAITQIRASMSSLIKPSGAAAEALRKLGYENSQQLVRAKGLVGAFQAMISTTDGQANSIAKLFPNVRALNGVLRLTNSGLEDYGKILKNIQETDVSKFQDIFDRRIATDAERVTADLNKLKNFFTVEFGTALVKSTGDLFKTIGGVETLMDAMKSLATPVVAATGALVAFGTAAAGISLATKLNALDFAAAMPNVKRFTATLIGARNAIQLVNKSAGLLQGTLAGLPAAFAAYAAGDFLGNRYVNVLDKAREAFNEQQDKLIRRARATNDRIIAEEEVKNRSIVQQFESMLAEKRALYFNEIGTARETNERILSDSRSVLDRLVGVYEDHARERGRIADQYDREVTESRKRQFNAERTLEDRRFDLFNQQFSQADQFFNLQKRTTQLTNQAASNLAKAKTPDQRENALDDFRRAQAAAEQALSIAEQTNNLDQKLVAEKAIQRVLVQQIAAEKQLQALSEQSRKRAESDAAKAAERIKRLNQAAKSFLDNSNFFDGQGEALPREQIEAQRQQASQSLGEFFRIAAEGGEQIKASDLLAFQELNKSLSSAATEIEIQTLRVAPQALEKLERDIQGVFNKFSIAIDDSQALTNLAEQISELSKREAQADEIFDRIRRRAGVAGAAIQADFNNNKLTNDVFINLEGGEFAEQFRQLREEIIRASTDTEFLQSNFENLTKRAALFNEQFSGGFSIVQAGARNAIANSLQQLQSIVQERENLVNNFGDVLSGENEAKLNELRQQLDNVRANLPAIQSGTNDAAIKATNAQAALSNAVSPTAQLASNLGTAAAHMERLQRAASVLSFGAIPSTLPASPGVPQTASRPPFYSQLQGLNAPSVAQTSQPQSAGQVTELGGVTINVNGASNPRTTAQEVASALQRLGRRGGAQV